MAISKTTKGKGRNFRSTDEGAGMTSKGVKAYRKVGMVKEVELLEKDGVVQGFKIKYYGIKRTRRLNS